MKELGFDIEFTKKCLDANKHNNVTTTYYLLLKVHRQNGGQSHADINSPNFNEILAKPKEFETQILSI